MFAVADIFDHFHRLFGFTVCIIPSYTTTVTQRLSTIITIDYLNDLTFAAAETFPAFMLTHMAFLRNKIVFKSNISCFKSVLKIFIRGVYYGSHLPHNFEKLNISIEKSSSSIKKPSFSIEKPGISINKPSFSMWNSNFQKKNWEKPKFLIHIPKNQVFRSAILVFRSSARKSQIFVINFTVDENTMCTVSLYRTSL